MLNFFMQQQDADSFFQAMQGYFNKPMTNTSKIMATAILVLVILFILFMMVRTIMFIWKGDNKKTLL